MALEQTKLEELMYLSLLGKFDYKHSVDDVTYICYTSCDVEENKDVKPVYITSTCVVSDKIALKRIMAFEKKAYCKDYVEFLEENGYFNKLAFSKRIKDYIEVFCMFHDNEALKEVIKNYRNNFVNLLKEELIDKEQFEAGVEYVTRQFNKVMENVH